MGRFASGYGRTSAEYDYVSGSWSSDGPAGTDGFGGFGQSRGARTTGRYLILMKQDATESVVQEIARATGKGVVSAAEFGGGAVEAQQLAQADSIVFPRLGVAVVKMPPDQVRSIRAAMAPQGAILATEPERIVYALGRRVRPRPAPGDPALPDVAIPPLDAAAPPIPVTRPPARGLAAAQLPLEYLLGYRDAVNQLVDLVVAAVPAAVAPSGIERVRGWDETEATWGLQATKVTQSAFSGRGIKVAVLDTGLDLTHPDFAGRKITAQSFVQGEAVQDGMGHGTHCIGTACGPKQPDQLPRYGIAYDAEIFVGKVLDNQGSGTDANILAGIEWAITNGCPIVSMSLGADVAPGDTFSPVFEEVARRALAAGTLIIAAAGNASHRQFGDIEPVGHPANCPSIMAVGALDKSLRVAWFSSGGLNPDGGQVDIAAPGVDVHSSWPEPRLYNTISGTSMATPHVSGIAALLAEANPTARGHDLWALLTQHARRLSAPSRDVGAGLVQAP